MTRLRLTRRGRRVAWALYWASVAVMAWAVWRGYEDCLAAGHAWAKCAAL